MLKETRDNIASEANAKLRPNGSTNHIQAANILIEACRSSTDSSDHRKVESLIMETLFLSEENIIL